MFIAPFLRKLQFIDVIASFITTVTAQWRAEVVILFAVALNDPQANMNFFSNLRRASRRRVCSAKILGTATCGPVLTPFGQSFYGEKHYHLRPKRCPY